MWRAMLMVWVLTSAAPAAQVVEGRVINAVTGGGIPGVNARIFPVPGVPTDRVTAVSMASRKVLIPPDVRLPASARFHKPATGCRRLPSAPATLSGSRSRCSPCVNSPGRVVDAAGKPVPNAGVWLVGRDRCASRPPALPIAAS